jgi:hypothetical protein
MFCDRVSSKGSCHLSTTLKSHNIEYQLASPAVWVLPRYDDRGNVESRSDYATTLLTKVWSNPGRPNRTKNASELVTNWVVLPSIHWLDRVLRSELNFFRHPRSNSNVCFCQNRSVGESFVARIIPVMRMDPRHGIASTEAPLRTN